ncbi:MAG TPA: GtrA family protein [Candidatus Dormibacteraeota bacterium]|nr:GtrA family protein [Candidatus Dormibacteraeota bacterium]
MAKQKTGAQVGRFGLIGVLNTVIDYVVFIGLTKLFSIPLDRVWTAKLVSGALAMANSFYFNKTWVFKSGNKHAGQQFARFMVSTLVGVFIIQLGLVQFFSSVFPDIGQLFYLIAASLGVTALLPAVITQAFVIKTVAFGLATIASMSWNFLLYKFWAFKS